MPVDALVNADAPPPVDAGVDAAVDAGVIKMGVLSGTIRRADTKAPIAGIDVWIQPSSPVVQNRADTDKKGHYSFAAVPEGKCTVTLIEHDNASLSGELTKTVDVKAKTTLDFTITIGPPRAPIPMPYGAPPARRRVV